jgi:hypothetical protein
VRPKGVIDGNQVNIPGPVGSDECRKLLGLIGLLPAVKVFLEITPTETVPETDTGGLVEHTKALERTMLKELGKLHA